MGILTFAQSAATTIGGNATAAKGITSVVKSAATVIGGDATAAEVLLPRYSYHHQIQLIGVLMTCRKSHVFLVRRRKNCESFVLTLPCLRQSFQGVIFSAVLVGTLI